MIKTVRDILNKHVVFLKKCVSFYKIHFIFLIMTFSETNKEKHLRRIKSTVTQSQVQESNDGHPLGKMLSGKMLAPSPAFQKALLGIYHMPHV